MVTSDNAHEYIWIGDFKDRNLGAKVFDGLGVRTWHELSYANEIMLKEVYLDDTERKAVERLLGERSLVLSEIIY